jgi:hypothetical protein
MELKGRKDEKYKGFTKLGKKIQYFSIEIVIRRGPSPLEHLNTTKLSTMQKPSEKEGKTKKRES